MSDHPNLSGMTPAEQVRALDLQIGDTIECRHEYDGGDWIESRRQLMGIGRVHCLWDSWHKTKAMPRWTHAGENSGYLSNSNWRKISSDPALDPAEPLRAELREAYGIIEDLTEWPQDAGRDVSREKQWLDRNAAFGAEGGESK